MYVVAGSLRTSQRRYDPCFSTTGLPSVRVCGSSLSGVWGLERWDGLQVQCDELFQRARVVSGAVCQRQERRQKERFSWARG